MTHPETRDLRGAGGAWAEARRPTLAVIGQDVPLLGAGERVLGGGGFLHQFLPAGCLVGVALTLDAASRIESVDVEPALRVDGVRAALGPQDTAGLRWPGGELLATRATSHEGEPVAAVAAESFEVAMRALSQVRVKAQRERERGGSGRGGLAERASMPSTVAPVAGEAGPTLRWNDGDVAAGEAEAAFVVEDVFTFEPVAGPHQGDPAFAASWSPAGECTLWSPGPAPFVTRDRLAASLSVASERIRVVPVLVPIATAAPGGVWREEILAALLARLAGRPVAWRSTRRDDGGHGSSPEVTLRLRTGARGDGTLAFREAKARVRAGTWVADDFRTPTLLGRALFRAYPVCARSVEVTVVPGKCCHPADLPDAGNREAAFALESQMQSLAALSGVDPVALRARNQGPPAESGRSGVHPGMRGVLECAAGAAEAVGLRDKHATSVLPRRVGESRAVAGTGAPSTGADGGGFATPRKGVGLAVAIAPGVEPLGRDEGCGAAALLDEGGRVTVACAAADPARGLDTLFAQIAAEVLGLPVERVRVVRPDTREGPWDAGGTAARALCVGGNAVFAAASDLRDRVVASAAGLLGIRAERISLAFGKVYVAEDPTRSVPLEAFLARAREAGAGSLFAGAGSWRPPEELGGAGPGGFMAGGVAACAAEVEVDTQTGRVQVLRLVVVADVGRILHPTLQAAHLEGDAARALARSLALSAAEAARAPRPDQLPRVEAHLLEAADGPGPFGAKGLLGWGGLPVAAAVANAVADAVGVRMTTLPITPGRVREALRKHGDLRMEN
ncbi:MAG: xanthine dehydrogenase family protein molybdopterin-binding subunit [Planctomycetes bacterium]|nr:xanthine dehydrogenase family protein molybdopterin-binding subunit [Planctomycetota bacterium]